MVCQRDPSTLHVIGVQCLFCIYFRKENDKVDARALLSKDYQTYCIKGAPLPSVLCLQTGG